MDYLTEINYSRRDDENSLAATEIEMEDARNENAISAFESYVAETTENPKVPIYLGNSSMEVDHFDKALKTFEKLEEGKSLDCVKANWHKSLVYLKARDTVNANQVLKDIFLTKEILNTKKPITCCPNLNSIVTNRFFIF